MAVARWLARFAFREPHVLVVEAASGTPLRLSVEAVVRRYGWPLVSTPADADLLVTCGRLDSEMTQAVDRLLRSMPMPRDVLHLVDEEPEQVPDALLDARRRLTRQIGAPEPETPTGRTVANGRSDAGHAGHAGHAGREHDASESRGDGHRHGDMEMPGGLPMADRGEDRDGMDLDVVHLPLGPVLTGWPPGLAVTLRIQGDVVQAVEVHTSARTAARSWWDEPWLEALDGRPVAVAVAERRRAASHLDSLTRLLWVAGDEGSASRAARLRDGALAGADPVMLRAGVAALGRRLDRWRLLHRVTAGTGALNRVTARRLGVSGPALRATGEPVDLREGSAGYPGFEPAVVSDDGDARARWRQWLVEVDQALYWAEQAGGYLEPVDGRLEGPRGSLDERTGSASFGLVRAVAELLPGQELAAARLTVGSLDPDLVGAVALDDRDAEVG